MPRLTEHGKKQAREAQSFVNVSAVEVVFVSPLSRTIETALEIFGTSKTIIALDIIRETIGVHPCDRRRPTKLLKADFPSVDLSLLLCPDDEKWTMERETGVAIRQRARGFWKWLHERKEKVVAVVSHNDFLRALFHEEVCGEALPSTLRHRFGNAEVRATYVEFGDRLEFV